MTELVHLDTASGTATITLNSPHNRNALSRRLRTDLAAHLATALADPAVRIVVLTHADPVFCAGADLKEAAACSDEEDANPFPAILETLWTSPKPVVARLAGPARAGGLGLVAASDLAIAVETATFAFSEVRIGVVPAVISVPVLARLAPRAAQALFLTGATFDAIRAAEIGLLTEVVPADHLDAAVAAHVDALALGAPQALAATKELLSGGSAKTLAADLAAMGELSARHFASAEGQEGITAFREKRHAAWVPERTA
ncbi:enoyl-CoA hydratase-related protein [Streptomyces libani]|uniref:enoyl-CoA hydratase-related protein n=1 Tax=Streptomyces nigrescens TaxID=1920 RepID=UPI003823BFB8